MPMRSRSHPERKGAWTYAQLERGATDNDGHSQHYTRERHISGERRDSVPLCGNTATKPSKPPSKPKAPGISSGNSRIRRCGTRVTTGIKMPISQGNHECSYSMSIGWIMSNNAGGERTEPCQGRYRRCNWNDARRLCDMRLTGKGREILSVVRGQEDRTSHALSLLHL